jgi:prepilin-type N-terminal cleavage/methylation domain-containing protein
MVRDCSPLPRRGGFTLVELLVVIAIIAVLAALVAGTAFTVIEGQRASRTEDTMRNLDKMLHQHWHKVVEDAKGEQPSDATLALANNDTTLAQVLWVKFRLMEAFPQSFAEINNPWVYSNPGAGNAAYIPLAMRKYNDSYKKGIAAMSASHQPGTESASCLYLILRVNRGSQLDEQNLAQFIGDTDGDGVKELIDGWGNPLTFIRFPIGTTTTTSPVMTAALLAEINTLNPAKTTARGKNSGDPDDPDGVLQQNNWFNTGSGKFFTANVHKVSATQPYFTPVIISNGRDGILNSPAGSPDDIYSWRLRIGAKG